MNSTNEPEAYQQLLEYKKQGYVFHGSTNPNITVIEPRSATDNDKDNTFNNDTAIFATKVPEASVVFACNSIDNVPREIGGGNWKIGGTEDGKLIANYPKKWQPYITKNTGYVYVLSSSTFTDIGGWQVKSKQAVTPIAKIPVSFSDFEKLGGIIFWKD